MNRLVKIAAIVGIAGAGASALFAAPGGSTSSPEMVTKSMDIQARASVDMQHVVRLQAEARHAKDIIKLNCINDKLTLIRPSLNIIDRLTLEVRASEDAGGSFSQVVAAGENVRRLREEADQCAGEPMSATTSWNDYTMPPPSDNPYLPPWGAGGTVVVEPPGYASPFD